jgi:hypothetical protein
LFGIFKKKQPTALDGVIRVIYGDNPPAKSADLERAITIAHEDLLAEQVPMSEVRRIASGLAAGPIPYSTYDLSVATALSFFKNPELFNVLEEIQIGARVRVLNWMKGGKVAPGMLKIFEDALYRLYKPSAEAAAAPATTDEVHQSQANQSDEVSKKYQGSEMTLHEASRMVGEFFIWQHNSLAARMMDYDCFSLDAEETRDELAFLHGACVRCSAEYALPPHRWNDFLANVVGRTVGFQSIEHLEPEISQLDGALVDAHRAEIARVGEAAFGRFIENGECEQDRYALALAVGYRGDEDNFDQLLNTEAYARHPAFRSAFENFLQLRGFFASNDFEEDWELSVRQLDRVYSLLMVPKIDRERLRATLEAFGEIRYAYPVKQVGNEGVKHLLHQIVERVNAFTTLVADRGVF